jgi:putative ABC transport system permease protein
MMLLEHFLSAAQSLAGNRTRTALSAIGIVIGVASVIAVTSLGEGAQASITAEIAKAGLEIITAAPGRRPQAATLKLFTEETAGELAGIEGVKAVLPMEQKRFTFRAGGSDATDSVVAASPEMGSIYSLKVARGRFIDANDMAERTQVVVLGKDLADELFPEGDAVGSTLKLLGEAPRLLRVVGVLEEKSPTMGMDFDATAFVPRTTYLSRLAKPDRVGSFLIYADSGGDVMKTASRVTEWFEARTGSDSEVRVMSPSTVAETMSGVMGTLSAFLAGIAAISLLVGGIGIMNIMLVSVAERTKEIGIRKALGASPRAIRAQFLVEAVVLTATGGGLGVGLGALITAIVSAVMGWPFSLPLQSVALAIGVSACTGIFFGMYPASRAARMDPVAALAFE